MVRDTTSSRPGRSCRGRAQSANRPVDVPSPAVADINMLWHATAMAPDYDGLLGPLQRLFGAVVMHDTQSEAPGVGRRGGMIWIGDNSIEIGAPLGPVSPVRNFVERWGGGMHSIALHVDDAKATAERLAGLGVTPQAWLDDHIMFT